MNGYNGGTDRITVGPLFDLPDDEMTFEDKWHMGSRIGVEHFDKPPHGEGPAMYETTDGLATYNRRGNRGVVR